MRKNIWNEKRKCLKAKRNYEKKKRKKRKISHKWEWIEKIFVKKERQLKKKFNKKIIR